MLLVLAYELLTTLASSRYLRGRGGRKKRMLIGGFWIRFYSPHVYRKRQVQYDNFSKQEMSR